MIEVVNKFGKIEITNINNVDITGINQSIEVNILKGVDVKPIAYYVEVGQHINLEVVQKSTKIDIYKSGLSAGGGVGDSLWQSSGLEIIEPKFNKKVDASSLVGTVEGGLFQP